MSSFKFGRRDGIDGLLFLVEQKVGDSGDLHWWFTVEVKIEVVVVFETG